MGEHWKSLSDALIKSVFRAGTLSVKRTRLIWHDTLLGEPILFLSDHHFLPSVFLYSSDNIHCLVLLRYSIEPAWIFSGCIWVSKNSPTTEIFSHVYIYILYTFMYLYILTYIRYIKEKIYKLSLKTFQSSWFHTMKIEENLYNFQMLSFKRIHITYLSKKILSKELVM